MPLHMPDTPYKAFSGSNIYATIGETLIGTLQSITVSITREVAALYSFGDANPKAFVKGKRGIAGTLVFTQYDRHAILRDIFQPAFDDTLGSSAHLFSSKFVTQNLGRGTGVLSPEAIQTRNFSADIGSVANSSFAGSLDSDLQEDIRKIYNLVQNQKLRYSDQIPEFDVVITMVNESGDAAALGINGIVLANEGFGYTLDDLVSEVAFTYVARSIVPLTPLVEGTRNKHRTGTQLSNRYRMFGGGA